jgi:hypothetical protein
MSKTTNQKGTNEMSNQTTLTYDQVCEIANEMGIKDEGIIGGRWYWSIQGYEIVTRSMTRTYQIKMDGDVLVEGKGDIIDALRDFITAES